MLCASIAPSIWCENSLKRRMYWINVLSWTSWEGLAIIISSITGNETQRVTWFSLKSLRSPWMAGAAPVAPKLRSDRTVGKFVVTPLLTAFLSFLLHLCKWEGREEEKQLQFFLFYIICFNTYDWQYISDLKIKFVNSFLGFRLLRCCGKLDSCLGRFGGRVCPKAA